ncbi:MAG: transglycosylase SLT domain-containing protein [Chitinispirillaceae bacterium]|nr:transglycosylase SLT domain-containing protein [Chitinispirillaceae bacterium]
MIRYCILIAVAISLPLQHCSQETTEPPKPENTPAGAPSPTNTILDTLQPSPVRKDSSSAAKNRKKGRILRCALRNSRFNPQKWLEEDRTFPPPGPPGRISRFDPVIKKMARRYGFDWRLIAAQIYAESGFDSTAKSYCGARGLMQVMPKTAWYLGTDPLELEQPEVNIATGCMYDRKMVVLWKKNVNQREEQLAFALASYNAGRSRVLRSFSTEDSLTEWEKVYPMLPTETQDYVHRIALKYDFYSRHALP